MNSLMFETLELNRLFVKCVVPTVVTCIFAAIYTAADGIFVGRFIGEDALAAVNLIMPVLLIVVALVNMIAAGSSVNISMLLGQKNREEASKVFTFSIKVILAASVIMGLAGCFLGESILHILAPDASEAAIKAGVDYLFVISIMAPLLTVYFATDNYLRVCGRMKTSMIVNIATQLLNIILDVILIAVLHKGVMAAAFATAFSISLGSIYTLVLFAGKKTELFYTKESIELRRFMRILANGSSEFFSSISFSVMSIVVNLFLLKYGQTTAVAAYSVVMYVDAVIGMVCFGICEAMQPAISYCYGAGLGERTRGILKRVLAASFGVSVIAFLFMYFAGPSVSHIFIKPGNDELAEMVKGAIMIFAFSYFAGWIDMCLSSFFTAIDKPLYSLIVSVSGSLIIPCAALVVLADMYGLTGVWLMAPVSSVLSAMVALGLLYRLRKEI